MVGVFTSLAKQKGKKNHLMCTSYIRQVSSLTGKSTPAGFMTCLLFEVQVGWGTRLEEDRFLGSQHTEIVQQIFNYMRNCMSQ